MYPLRPGIPHLHATGSLIGVHLDRIKKGSRQATLTFGEHPLVVGVGIDFDARDRMDGEERTTPS